MSPETKQEALRKLHVIRNKIGYLTTGATTQSSRLNRMTSSGTSRAPTSSKMRAGGTNSANRLI